MLHEIESMERDEEKEWGLRNDTPNARGSMKRTDVRESEKGNVSVSLTYVTFRQCAKMVVAGLATVSCPHAWQPEN